MEELAFYKGKRIFVTGHTGFKGGWLCRTLALAGAEVFGYALPPQRGLSFYGLCSVEDAVRGVFGDVRDAEALRAALCGFSPDIVFHLAAQPIVGRGYREPLETFGANLMGTVCLLEAVRACPRVKSVLIVTTDKVYRPGGGPRSERAPLGGDDPYAASKACAEIAAACYRTSWLAEAGVALSTARAGNAIGGGDFGEDRLVPDFFRAAGRGEPLALRSPRSVRPYQFVLEPVAAYLRIAAAQAEDASLAGAYNVGPAAGARTALLADMLAEAWGGGGRIRAASRFKETEKLELDSAKAERVFGIRPRTDLADAVRYTVEWERARLSGADMAAFTDGQIASFFSLPVR